MIHFDVDGMTCSGCARSVEKALLRADPQAHVTVELETGKVDVDSSVARDVLAAAIESAGYDIRA